MQNDGGGGNLGYMFQGRRQGEKDKKYLDESIFLKQNNGDVFGLDKKLEIPKEQNIIEKIINFVKNLLAKK